MSTIKRSLPGFNGNGNSEKAQIQSYLPQYLAAAGIDYHKKFTCLNPNHADHNPSMSYDPKIQRVHCFGCGVTYDIFDLYALDHLKKTPDANNQIHYQFKQAYNGVADLLGINVRRLKVKPEDEEASKINQINSIVIRNAQKHLNDPAAVAYLKKRGISMELAQKFGLGYAKNWVNPTISVKEGKELTPTPRLIIPTGNGSSSYLARDTRGEIPEAEKKYQKQKQGSLNLFNAGVLQDDSEPIFVTEGEFDALSIMEVTNQAHALALGSTANVDLFCGTLRKIKREKQRRHLDYDPVILISMDNDAAGRLASNELETRLNSDAMGITNYVVNIAKSSNDPNEELTTNKKEFIAEVKARINDPDDYLTGLIKRIAENKTKPHFVPTGFDNLDKMLDGGLYPQLYVIGALSSVGKTTFTMQMASRIAAYQKRPVFYFSLETSKDELTEKNLSRLSFDIAKDSKSGYPQTVHSINNGKWLDNKANAAVMGKAIDQYSKYYSLIHIYDGTRSRPSAITIYNQIKRYRRKHPDVKPVVMVDYLQILKPINDKDTDKETVTKSISTFKQIASEFSTPVVVISSFNRSSYQTAAAMESFKESGEIEYYADTLLGLQYKVIHDKGKKSKDFDQLMNEAKKKNPRDIELSILKNRNGQSSGTVSFKYYAKFNNFVPFVPRKY